METKTESHGSVCSLQRPTTAPRTGWQQPAADPAGGAAGPKACATCRLAHASCDREQPCGRCVRLGKTDSCQPPPTRKRGRPPRNKPPSSPPPDDHQPRQDPATLTAVPSHHHQRPPQPPHTTTTAQAQAGTKRMRFTVATATTPTTTSSTSSSSTSPSSSPPVAQEQGQQEQEGLRSLLGLVADQMREMRRENERLHDTIAQLRATQDEMRLEAERLRNTVAELRVEQRETERRLARVESDLYHHHHQTTLNSRQQKKKLNEHLDAKTPEAGPSTMPDVAQFIAQTLPFLRSYDYSSLILRDLHRPFFILRTIEAETLDDMDMPIIAYASPSMCQLLGYDHGELHGLPVCLMAVVAPEAVLMCVERRLMRPPTPVGEPFFVSCSFTTKQGRSVPVLVRQQLLYSPQRLASWHITQVERVLATDLAAPAIKPAHNSAGNDNPGKRLISSSVHEPRLRAYLVARLPHWLLFGRCGELTTAARPHHSFGDHHSGTAAAQQRAPPPPSGLDVTAHERRAEGNNDDNELEELVRALGLPLHRGGSPVFGQRTNFADAPPVSLAERWMRC